MSLISMYFVYYRVGLPFMFLYKRFYSYGCLACFKYFKNIVFNGSDGISARYFYLCHYAIMHPFFSLFQRSLSEGTVPSVWKIGSVSPNFIYGDLSYVKNYRPGSIILYIAKLFIVYTYIKCS